LHDYEGLDPVGGFDRTNLLAPLRNRDFRFLWAGMSVSLLGDGVFMVAVAWQAYELSDVPTALSLVGLAMTLPHVLLLLLGGVVSDRFARRKVMLAADIVRGVAIASIAALALSGDLSLMSLALLAGLYGGGTAFFGPAFDAIVPDIIPAEMLPQANSLDQLMKPLMLRLGGPALGGLVIGLWGAPVAFAFDALTFIASAGALMMMRTGAVNVAADGTSMLGQLADGFRFIKRNVWLWGTFGAAAVAYLLFMGPAEVLLPYLLKEELGGSATDLGIVFAMGGLGSIASATFMGAVRVPRRCMTFIYMTWTLSTAAIAFYAVASASWHLFVASFAFNLLETAGTIVWVTTKQRHVPPALLGRVSSLDWLVSIGLVPISFALTGPLATAVGVRGTLATAGLLGAAVTGAAYFLPGMRDLEDTGNGGPEIIPAATEA
jgi:hypothetical protein